MWKGIHKTKRTKPDEKPDKNAAKAESTLFTTPENSHFYSKIVSSKLDPINVEIRLLELHPKRLKPADLPRVFPHWIRPGTDATQLQEPTHKPIIQNLEIARLIEPPSSVDETIQDQACKQLIKPLPEGWISVSVSYRKCSFIL